MDKLLRSSTAAGGDNNVTTARRDSIRESKHIPRRTGEPIIPVAKSLRPPNGRLRPAVEAPRGFVIWHQKSSPYITPC